MINSAAVSNSVINIEVENPLLAGTACGANDYKGDLL